MTSEERSVWRDAVRSEIIKIVGPRIFFKKRQTGLYVCRPWDAHAILVGDVLNFPQFLLCLRKEGTCNIHFSLSNLGSLHVSDGTATALILLDDALESLITLKAIVNESQNWTYANLVGVLSDEDKEDDL